MLIVEDDPLNQRLLRRIFEGEFHVRVAPDAPAALLEVEREPPSVVILDRGLPSGDGLELLERLRLTHPDLPVIILTGRADVAGAVRAIQLGAVQYLEKPFDRELLLATVHSAVRRRATSLDLARSMGPSTAVQQVIAQVAEVAASPYSVLIHGETGTGKELVARAIHEGSPRRTGPFVAVDCGAIPESLLESELFGHERGAFTGADRARPGSFRIAHGGTLFLDELLNLPLALQAKLLRAVQEREVHPIGAAAAAAVDVRIIAASNRPLPEEVKAGRFRSDLYFRIAEFTIVLPSLRERHGDIAHLARRFVREAADELRRPPPPIDADALALLERHGWPGNVLELRNVIRRAVLASPRSIAAASVSPLLSDVEQPPAPVLSEPPPPGRSLREIAEAAACEAERRAIVEALAACHGNRAQTAKRLQVDAKTLYNKIKRYRIESS